MLYLYCVFLVWYLALILAGVMEQRLHTRRLESIPVRILVNGIRGKSSITRLCAGAIRGGGKVVVGKTTGTAARFIYPDGTEEPVYRKFGLANVIEQVGIVRRAAMYHPDALVIECMAVTPDLQELSQRKLIRSTIGVLSNVRADHLVEMGPQLTDVARSLSRSMPVGGVCVTAEREHIQVLRDEAEKRTCRLIEVDPESVTDEEMSRFGWVTFKENVAIALAVADLAGVDRERALKGMWAAPPDPGALSVRAYRAGIKLVLVANIFAANDPQSTLMNIQTLATRRQIARPIYMIINCRPDRIERNAQMGELTADIEPDKIIVIGTPARSATTAIPAQFQSRVRELGGERPASELLAGILHEVRRDAALVLVGNVHGQGEILLEELEKLTRVRFRPPPLRTAIPWRPARRPEAARPEAPPLEAPPLEAPPLEAPRPEALRQRVPRQFPHGDARIGDGDRPTEPPRVPGARSRRPATRGRRPDGDGWWRDAQW